MDTSPFISIIMPAYNCERFIAEAIESIQKQTHANWELLIGDDGSTDQTRHIAQSFAAKDQRIKVLQRDENVGYLQTCNELFEKCKGDLITFQDADDWSLPERLSRQVSQFLEDPRLGICGTWARYFDVNGKKSRTKCPAVTDKEIRENIFSANQFCGASVMIRKDVLLKVGKYRLFFDRIGNEDYDWTMRIVEKFNACNISEFLYCVRLVPGSISKNPDSPYKFFSGKLAVFLAMERKQFGKDSLDFSPPALLNAFVATLEKPFLDDPSKIFREAAFTNFHAGLKKQSLQYGWRACKTRPLKILNWKVFIDLLIKSI